jgi:hypothetical protein
MAMALFDSVVVIARSYTALPRLTPSESIRRNDSANTARPGFLGRRIRTFAVARAMSSAGIGGVADAFARQGC